MTYYYWTRERCRRTTPINTTDYRAFLQLDWRNLPILRVLRTWFIGHGTTSGKRSVWPAGYPIATFFSGFRHRLPPFLARCEFFFWWLEVSGAVLTLPLPKKVFIASARREAVLSSSDQSPTALLCLKRSRNKICATRVVTESACPYLVYPILIPPPTIALLPSFSPS